MECWWNIHGILYNGIFMFANLVLVKSLWLVKHTIIVVGFCIAGVWHIHVPSPGKMHQKLVLAMWGFNVFQICHSSIPDWFEKPCIESLSCQRLLSYPVVRSGSELRVSRFFHILWVSLWYYLYFIHIHLCYVRITLS